MKAIITLAIFLVSLDALSQEFIWDRFQYPIGRYAKKDALKIGDNIVDFQRSSGGWSKRLKPGEEYTTVERLKIKASEKAYALLYDTPGESEYSHNSSSLDNGATHSHIRYLLRLAKATQKTKYIESARKGIQYLLSAQTVLGGWPQNYPNISSYGGYVTFNDGAMVGAMKVLQEISRGDYSFIDSKMRDQAKMSFGKGVQYILSSQIVINGEKTGWCAQYARVGYSPERGRTYELPAISSASSTNVVRLLMSIDNPEIRVRQSIVQAIKWFESAKIQNTEIKRVYDEKLEEPFFADVRETFGDPAIRLRKFDGRGFDIRLIKSESTRPIWARFYDIELMKPIFSSVDGIKRFSLKDISYERRTGYRWYGYWPQNLLESDWPAWKKKWM